MSQIDTHYCRLRRAAEVEMELCTKDVCAFWEPGGAVLEGRCIVERLGTDLTRTDLAAYLLEIRQRLEAAREPSRTPTRGERR